MLHVETEGFALEMSLVRREPQFSTPEYSCLGYREYVSYTVTTPDGTVFSGDTYSPSPLHKWGSPMSVIGLLQWICLTPGNDSALFAHYTDEQLTWSKSPLCAEYEGIFGDFDRGVMWIEDCIGKDEEGRTIVVIGSDCDYEPDYSVTIEMRIRRDAITIAVGNLIILANCDNGNVLSMHPVQIEGSPTIAELPTLYPHLFYDEPMSDDMIGNSNIYLRIRRDQ